MKDNELDTTKLADYNSIDWGTYYEKGKASLKYKLESNPEMWDSWTNWTNLKYERYVLMSTLCIIENDLKIDAGRVTGRLRLKVHSDTIENLENFWAQPLIRSRYDSTYQHFIADLQEKKIVKFLSVCM